MRISGYREQVARADRSFVDTAVAQSLRAAPFDAPALIAAVGRFDVGRFFGLPPSICRRKF